MRAFDAAVLISSQFICRPQDGFALITSGSYKEAKNFFMAAIRMLRRVEAEAEGAAACVSRSVLMAEYLEGCGLACCGERHFVEVRALTSIYIYIHTYIHAYMHEYIYILLR